MNGIEEIIGRIADDANQDAEAILTSARTEAADITEQYAALAAEERSRILADGEVRGREIIRRAASISDQERKQHLLAEKQRMIALAFDIALQRLSVLPEAEYVALLARLAADASSSGDGEIILCQKDHRRYGPRVLADANRILEDAGKKTNLVLAAETREFVGGLVLKMKNVEVNCTLDAIIRHSKEDLTLDIAATLFS